MFSKAMTAFGLLAIVIAPIVTFLLPNRITSTLLTSNVEIKDAVLLACVALLGISVFSARAIEAAVQLFSMKPYYKRVEVQYFYLADGTIIIRNKFDFVNGWSRSRDLPPDDLIWHRQITKSDLLYRFYERGKLRDRKMASDERTKITAVPQSASLGTDDHRYIWVPTVDPPLGIKEYISFVVEIMARRTETAAFRGGTKLGFGVNIRTSKVDLTAHAPFGYRFALMEPVVTIRNSSDLTEIHTRAPERPQPIVSPDGSVLTVNVRRPKSGRRYWIHYRFERLAA